MGVKGLTGLLLRLAPAAVQRHHISHYRGKALAVDVSCFLNRFIYGLDPHPARVQRGLYKLCLYFQQYEICPILVFDGPDRIIEKYQEGLRRAAQKEKIEKSFQLEKDRKSRLENLKQSSQMLQAQDPFQDIRLFPTRVSELELVESEMNKDYDKDSGKGSGKDSGKDNGKDESTLGMDNQSQRTDIANQADYMGEKDEDVDGMIVIPNQDDDDDNDTITDTTWTHPSFFSHCDQLQNALSMSKEYYRHEPLFLAEEHPLELGYYPNVRELELFEDMEMKQYLEHLMEGANINDIQTARDRTIQRCVHQVLQNFVQTIETSGQTPDQLHEISNQRQRILNTLEWKLVQEIKDMLSVNEGTSAKICSVMDIEGEQRTGNMPSGQAPKEQAEDNVSGEQESDDQEQTLRGMIQNVLSTHQSIFDTLERRTMSVTRNLVMSCQELARAMGQPVLEASGAEAESICAQLVTLGIADATVSEDTDTVVFGNGLLLRQVGVSNKEIVEINPAVARESLGLNRDAFRDLCILCGTDFSGTIEGIGPIRAARLIQYYGSIESIMANTDYTPRPTFLYDSARRVFDRTPHVPPDLLETHRRRPRQDQEHDRLAELLAKYDIAPEEMRKELAEDAVKGRTAPF